MTFGDALLGYAIRQQNPDQQAALGPSSTNLPCRRKMAFILHGVPEVAQVSGATVGTMLHETVTQAWLRWAEQEGYEPGELSVEQPVLIPGLPRSGQADVIDRRMKAVRDLKTLGRMRFDSWVDTGPPEHVWEQVQMYALGVGADHTWTVVIDGLCRETGRSFSWGRDYDAEAAAAAVQRIAELDLYLRSTDPMEVPADGKGRGSFPCDYCHVATLCLGPDLQPVPYHPDPETVQVAAERYLEMNRVIKEAETAKEHARADLADAEGQFGEYVIKRSTRSNVDRKEVAAAYREAYGQMPELPRSEVLRVTRAK
jgi:hypothetical protein